MLNRRRFRAAAWVFLLVVTVGIVGAMVQTDSAGTAVTASIAAIVLGAVFALIVYLRDSFR